MNPVGIMPNLGEILTKTVSLRNKQDVFVIVLCRFSKLDLLLSELFMLKKIAPLGKKLDNVIEELCPLIS